MYNYFYSDSSSDDSSSVTVSLSIWSVTEVGLICDSILESKLFFNSATS